MAEYITKKDAELVLRQLRKTYRRVDEKCAVDGCILEIRDMDSVDVIPANHGYWKWDGKHFYCSACAGVRYHDLILGLDAAYCPYCGAIMDESGEEDGK